MENSGVKCDVCECVYNTQCNKCSLPEIEVTHKTDSQAAVSVPHFCKSYERR